MRWGDDCMVVNGYKSLIIKCSLCNRLKEYEFNLFNIMKYDKIEYECSCGEVINISVQKRPLMKSRPISFRLKDVCFEIPLHSIIKRNSILRTFGDSLVFFLGEKEIGRKKIKELGMEVDDIVTERNRKDIFANFDTITKALIKLFDLDKDDKIKCECNSTNIKIELFSDRIELECLRCGSIKLIFAEREEDLEVLLNKDMIILKKSHITSIDSIVDNNKHINK